MRVSHNTSTAPRTLVRLCLGVIAVTTALLAGIVGIAWLIVDHSGRRLWKKAQSELREAGEPPSQAELHAGLAPHRIDVENYGAIPILQNIAAPAGQENRERLEALFFGYSRMYTRAYHLTGSPGLPASDLDALAEGLWKEVEELRYLRGPMRKKLPAEILNSGSALERISAYLQSWNSTIDEFYQGIDRQVAFFEPQLSAQADFSAPRSREHLAGINSVSEALYLRSLIAAHRGEREKLLLNLQTLSRLAEACANERDLFAHYRAATILLRLEGGIIEGLRTRQLQDDPDSLRRCLAMLQRVDLRGTLDPALRDYILSTNDSFADMSTLEGRVRHIPQGTEFSVPTWYPIGWYQNQQAIYAGIANEHIFNALRQQVCYGELIEACKRFDTALESTLTERHILIVLFTAMDGIHFIHYLPAYAEAYRRMALTACAIELYRLDHNGKSPRDLAELIPGYLDQIPTDPMDGAPLRYRHEGEQGYRLWSIGIDRTDDEGHLNLTVNRGRRVDLSFHNYTGDWPWPAFPEQNE